MWITPLALAVADATITFDRAGEPLPLPPWSGVPVAIELEVDRDTLAHALQLGEEGSLLARDEEGTLVRCPTMIDPRGSHTCESDTVLVLVQCGPFEPDGSAQA